jgi:hypothetical protein
LDDEEETDVGCLVGSAEVLRANVLKNGAQLGAKNIRAHWRKMRKIEQRIFDISCHDNSLLSPSKAVTDDDDDEALHSIHE